MINSHKDTSRSKINVLSKISINLVADLIYIAVILIVGYFLIGYYSRYEYLSTGYQDWIYQAFRVKSIQLHGLTSWDNIWANGINYWRIYQYLPHLLAAGVSNWLKISAAKSIMTITVLLFIELRLTLYMVLRWFKIDRTVALLAILLSYNIPQEWLAIKEYTIFFAAIYIPLYLFFYLKKDVNNLNLPILASLSGFAWNVHPVLGVLLTGLFATLFVFTLRKKLSTYFVCILAILGSSAAFFVNYFSVVYKFSNPYHLSSSFAKEVLTNIYYGLSLPILIGLVLSWVYIVTRWKNIDSRIKILAFISSVFIFFVSLAKGGQLPTILYETQFFRGIYFIGILIVVVIAFVLQSVQVKKGSFVFLSLSAVFSAILIVNAIQISSEYSGVPTNFIENPILSYFENKTPAGSVYYENDSEASFSNPSLRMSGSYNTHLLPSPLSLRFSGLLANEASYTGLSDTRAQLIADYSRVLGVEYFVLSTHSHLTDLSIQNSTQDIFKNEATVNPGRSSYTIIHSELPIHYAYLVEKSDLEALDNISLTKPTLNAQTYAPWDNQVTEYSKLFKSDKVTPIKLDFDNSNSLSITLDQTKNSYKEPILLVMQSYDQNWRISDSTLSVQPTSLRYMKISLPNSYQKDITLVNTWPEWHWPLQIFSLMVVVWVFFAQFIFSIWKKLS